MKIAVNRCWGGFGLSHEAIMAIAKRKGDKVYAWLDAKTAAEHGTVEKAAKAQKKNCFVFIHYTTVPQAEYEKVAAEDKKRGNYIRSNALCYDRDFQRHDPDLIAVVEEMGKAASSELAKVEVVEIPDGVDYEIDNYDGQETIHEKHRSW